jgi:hypothetical protein
MKNMDIMNKGYTPLIVGIVLYLLIFLIGRIGISGIGVLLVAMEMLIIPVIIGYLTGDYVRAIIYTIISSFFIILLAAVVTGSSTLSSLAGLVNLVVGWLILTVFSVVGVFVGKRLAPESTANTPKS